AEAEPHDHPGPRIVWCNEALCEMTGYGVDEIVGATPRIFQGEETCPDTRKAIRNCLETWGSGRFEILNYRKSGEKFWTEIDLRPVADGTGWFHYWVSVQREITERKNAEELLGRAREHMERVNAELAAKKSALEAQQQTLARQAIVAEHARDGVVIADVNGMVEWANNAFVKMTGYTLEELRGKKPGQLLRGRDTDPSAALELRRAMRDRRHCHVEILNYAKSGAPYWVEITLSPVFDEAGELRKWIAVERDTTLRLANKGKLQKAKNEAEQLSQRLRLAASAAGVGFWTYNVTRNQLEWDDVMFDHYGVKRSDFRGIVEDWSERVHPDDLPAAQEALQRAVDGGEDFDSRFRVVRPDGEERHITAHAALDRREDDELVLIGVNWDATTLMHALQRAEAANVAKSTFLANMSHEVRTPLNGVLGMASMLAKTPLGREQQRMIDVITNSGDALVRIVDDILDISKIEAGKLQIEQIDFDIDDIVASVVSVVTQRADEKGVRLEVSPSDLPPRGYVGDPTRIRQILTNLVSNAIKFTDAGSVTVDVRARPISESDAISLSVEVTDTGPGVDPAVAKRLFTPFTQADASSSRRHGGAGLGLAISKQLCEMMGGGIELESAPGGGSTFRFFIPVQSAAAQADGTADALGAPRVLVAEDNPTNRMVLEMILSSIDAEVTMAENGQEAVDAYAGGEFDIVLMDIQMPELSGVEATRRIRAFERDQRRAATPILAVTANVMEHQIAEYLTVGMNDCVAKPVKAGQLCRKIFELLAAENVQDQNIATG
ncbi:MAG: PAS domain-containing protein, partial [Caulobacterales bacterium]|nr:PAS domain-containing protein [Caulobacterales bacterium]